MTPLGVPVEEDRFSAMEAADQNVIYHIQRKEVTKEEWTQFHQKLNDQWKHREERAEEDMNNRRDPEDHEEVMGGNNHNEGDPPPEGTIDTL